MGWAFIRVILLASLGTFTYSSLRREKWLISLMFGKRNGTCLVQPIISCREPAFCPAQSCSQFSRAGLCRKACGCWAVLYCLLEGRCRTGVVSTESVSPQHQSLCSKSLIANSEDCFMRVKDSCFWKLNCLQMYRFMNILGSGSRNKLGPVAFTINCRPQVRS